MADSSEEKVALSEEPVWLKGTEGEVMAIRVDSRSTKGAYAVIEAPPGTRAIVPRNTPHSWRNIATSEGRLLVVVTPGGFEQLAYQVQDARPEQIMELSARYGCEILGPPTV